MTTIETEDGQQVEVGDLVYMRCSHARIAKLGAAFRDWWYADEQVVRIDQLFADEGPLGITSFDTTSGSKWAWNDERAFPDVDRFFRHQSGCVYSIWHALTNGWLNKRGRRLSTTVIGARATRKRNGKRRGALAG